MLTRASWDLRVLYRRPPACCAHQRHRAATVPGAPSTARTPYAYQPRSYRTTYGEPYRGTSGEARLKVYAGSRGGRAEATGGHVFELQRLQRALMQVVGFFCFTYTDLLTYKVGRGGYGIRERE